MLRAAPRPRDGSSVGGAAAAADDDDDVDGGDGGGGVEGREAEEGEQEESDESDEEEVGKYSFLGEGPLSGGSTAVCVCPSVTSWLQQKLGTKAVEHRCLTATTYLWWVMASLFVRQV